MSEIPKAEVASKFAVENADGMDGALKKARQGLDDWCKLHPPAFLESYLRNEICFCLKLRVGSRSLKIDSEDYYAVFSNLSRKGRGHAGNCDSLLLGIDPNLIADRHYGTDDDQELVFIKVVVLLDHVKNCVIRSLGCVRLYRADEFFRGTANAVYQSARTGFIEFFTRGVDGKLVLPSWSAAIASHEGTKQVIEARSKVMNNLASHNSEARRHDEGLAETYERILSPIVAELSAYSVRFRIGRNESDNFSVEILDVLFGPLNFCTTADKKVACVDALHTELVPEITPEMIEAGVKELYYFDVTAQINPTAEEAVKSIFLAMLRVRK